VFLLLALLNGTEVHSVDNESLGIGLIAIVILTAALTYVGRQGGGGRLIACACALGIGIVTSTWLSILFALSGNGH
jgi:hypothetical protein